MTGHAQIEEKESQGGVDVSGPSGEEGSAGACCGSVDGFWWVGWRGVSAGQHGEGSLLEPASIVEGDY